MTYEDHSFKVMLNSFLTFLKTCGNDGGNLENYFKITMLSTTKIKKMKVTIQCKMLRENTLKFIPRKTDVSIRNRKVYLVPDITQYIHT